MNSISFPQITKIGLGFTISYLAYKLFSSSSPPPSSTPSIESSLPLPQQQSLIQAQEEQNKHELTQLTELQHILVHKSSSFELETLPHNQHILTKACLLMFFSQTVELLDNREIVDVTMANRVARRAILESIQTKYETYFRFVCTLDQSIKYLVQKSQKDFSIFLNIDYQLIVDSLDYYLQTEDEHQCLQFRLQVVQIMASIRESLMNYMPLFNCPISKQLLMEILGYECQYLVQERDWILGLVAKMGIQSKEEEEAIPLFVTCFVEDVVWRRFQVQSEQMNVSAEDMDQELKLKFDKWKAVREDIIRSIHESIVLETAIILDEDSY